MDQNREELDRMFDDGCPNCYDYNNNPSSDIIDRAVDVAERVRIFNRTHRNIIHTLTLIILVYFVYREGFRPVDTAAVAMTLVTELLP